MDSHQVEREDPDPHQSDELDSDPDPHQRDKLDPHPDPYQSNKLQMTSHKV
jgi:hypothetical protein